MKNTWKGLVVGGLTGVAAGLLLDALQGASDRAHEVGRRVAEKAPVVADRLSDAAEHGVARVHEADLPSPVDLARSAAQRVGIDHQ